VSLAGWRGKLPCGRRTQLRLKQSCEQKKLSFNPSFRHVGHCRLPASFSQSTPIHFRFAGGSAVMLRVDVGGWKSTGMSDIEQL